MELQEAFEVLKEMMSSFETWYQMEGSDTQEDIEIYKERFAATRLSLEIGQYMRADYEYLFTLRDMVVDYMNYYEAITAFIWALSEEYGLIEEIQKGQG